MAGPADDKKSWGSGGLFAQRTLGSLLLMLLTPIVCLTFWYTCQHQEGSFLKLIEHIKTVGAVQFLKDVHPDPFNPRVWKLMLSFMGFELALMRLVPGKTFKATPTPSGHVPVYNANGFQCYTITLVALFALAYTGHFRPAEVYDILGNLLASLNVFALVFCLFLTIKGLNFPSTKDSGSNGSWIIDYFWGTELYPRILGFDVKQFTNCRFGLMFWQVAVICYGFKQYELYGFVSSSMIVSILLQTIYLAKFYWWETGYFCSMDIQHDRAGYYICWGCLVWVPSMYTIHTYFMVNHPVVLSLPVAAFLFLAGTYAIYVNYDCDRQRQEFRATSGKAKVWGAEPRFIEAKYTTKDGEERTSLLLASGWWGLARHFHYIPEITAAFLWSGTALVDSPLPLFYPVYLTLLLFDRAWRDDKRCSDKYGKYWDEYCKLVPKKVIPGII